MGVYKLKSVSRFWLNLRDEENEWNEQIEQQSRIVEQ